jgi:hypothetical protein
MSKHFFVFCSLIFTILLFTSAIGSAQIIDLSKAVIITSGQPVSALRATAIRVLQEEVASRTSVRLPLATVWGKTTVIALATSNDIALNQVLVPKRAGENLPENKKEGFRIFCDKKDGKNVIWIIGSDERGILYGIGKLLRTAILAKNKIVLEEPLDFAGSPMQSIRGHQLGYRNHANSYDAWDVKKYDKYIRDLVIFGTNSIETIPLGDKDGSVHFPIPPEEMNIQISEICAIYGIDYWVWTPVSAELSDNANRQIELDRAEAFYKKCPKLDGVFFPGGDPGENHPKDVLPFLKDLNDLLQKYHPGAGMWISLQGFNAEKIDYFYTYLEKNNPDWLRGVVTGPGSPPIAETRYRLPKKYLHRNYPDITHNVRCDYPVQNWDQAFMLTIGREGINPRPNFAAKTHAASASLTDGFISYSDGCHDDVNKVIWSMRGWDNELEPLDILADYCRYFFGPDLAKKGADGINALEQNWVGPIKTNGGIETTFEFWKKLETDNPVLSANWRWKMLVTRSYYDTYQQRRKIYEEKLEKEANKILAAAKETGSENAIKQALEMVNRADTKPLNLDMHQKIVQYCDDLFHLIGLQTDVKHYHAANSQRGCILQFVNYPLNNRWWLTDEFKKISEMDSEVKKLERLEVIRTWENPGAGSFYDNVSNIETGPRVLSVSYDAIDVAWWDGGSSRARLSSQLFQNEPILEYKNLDLNGKYMIRVCGLGDALIRVDGERLEPILYNKGIGEFKEFVVPREITRDGKMRVTFDRPEESHLRWSKYSHISDVWLIKK